MRSVLGRCLVIALLCSAAPGGAADLKCYQARHTKEVYAQVDQYIHRQSPEIQRWLSLKQRQRPEQPEWFQRVVVANCFDHPELSLEHAAEHVLNKWLQARTIPEGR